MLPEAESINKDGSQDGLMEAANIPLQSKEEDQMWKILNMDEMQASAEFNSSKNILSPFFLSCPTVTQGFLKVQSDN